MKFAAVHSPTSACSLHRVALPFKYLAKDAAHHEWNLSTSDRVSGFDTWYLYGVLRTFDSWAQIVNAKRLGKRLVYTMDDDIWHHPEWRSDPPTPEHIASVNLGLELADLVVASTPALAAEMGKPGKTVVCPNLLEVQRYQTPTPPPDDERVRICFAGGGGHWADLKIVDDALCKIKSLWKDRVEFHFLGDGPDNVLRDHLGDGVFLTDWYHLSEHWYRLHTVRPHIFVAPLVDCPFNRAKSNIRVIEGWSLNAAVVASPVAEYRVVRDGVNGLVADSAEEWVSALDRLIRDRELREALATNGHQKALRDHNWASPESRRVWAPVIEWADRQNN